MTIDRLQTQAEGFYANLAQDGKVKGFHMHIFSFRRNIFDFSKPFWKRNLVQEAEPTSAV